MAHTPKALYRDEGIVLRTQKLGEADRIVTVLTRRHGKVRAVAKGVRRPGSKFGGRLEPFSHVDLQLYEGRNLDVISQAELITPFDQVRNDYALSACGSAMVEAADRIAQEDERSNRLVLLLLEGLRALAGHPQHPSAVLDAYLLRLASVAGYHPYLEACANCGAPGPHTVFHLAAGGLLCPTCAPAGSHSFDPQVITLMNTYAAGELRRLDTAGAEPRIRRAAGTLVNSFLTYHLGKPLRAWDLVPR
jgi:DNA repair protein RecO (recombination protein O)